MFVLFFKLYAAVNLKTTDEGGKIQSPSRRFVKSQDEDSHTGTNVT